MLKKVANFTILASIYVSGGRIYPGTHIKGERGMPLPKRPMRGGGEIGLQPPTPPFIQ